VPWCSIKKQLNQVRFSSPAPGHSRPWYLVVNDPRYGWHAHVSEPDGPSRPEGPARMVLVGVLALVWISLSNSWTVDGFSATRWAGPDEMGLWRPNVHPVGAQSGTEEELPKLRHPCSTPPLYQHSNSQTTPGQVRCSHSLDSLRMVEPLTYF
jgi:hypothetical protein